MKKITRRSVIKSAGGAIVGGSALIAGSESAMGQVAAQQSTLGQDTTITDLSFTSVGKSGNVSGGANVNTDANRIEAAIRASGLVRSESGQGFGLLGAAVEFTGPADASQDAKITYEGRYNGYLDAGLGLSSAFVTLDAVTDSPTETQETTILNSRRRFGRKTHTNDYTTTQSATIDANTQYLLYVALTIGASAEVGTATADFGPQIGDPTTPPQGAVLDRISVDFL